MNVDIEALRKRYTASVVPPCRICGAELQLHGFGPDGADYMCSGATARLDSKDPKRTKADRDSDWTHLSDSKYHQYQTGSDMVLAACDELVALRAEIARLTRERAAMRPVVEAACYETDVERAAGDDEAERERRDVIGAQHARIAAVDAYRASQPKGGSE